MRRFHWSLLGLLSLTYALGSAPRSRAAEEAALAGKPEPIAWHASLSEAKQAAAKQKKPLFVDFYADWCTPCKEMLRTTYQDRAVVARSRRFVPVLVNFDKQGDLAKTYGVDALPTVVFLDSRGKVLLRSVGYTRPQDFLKLMARASRKAKR